MFQTNVVEKTKTHSLSSIIFFPENHAVYEIMWKHIVEPGRPQMTVRRQLIACWIPEATKTHAHAHTHTFLEYVIVIAFPLQQCLHERASMLRYTYIVSLV